MGDAPAPCARRTAKESANGCQRKGGEEIRQEGRQEGREEDDGEEGLHEGLLVAKCLNEGGMGSA